MITMEVFQALSHSIKEVPFAYNMTRAMQAPAFTLMKRGVKVDMARRGEVLNSLSLQRARAEEIFFRLCTEGLGLEPYFDKKHKKHFAINPAPRNSSASFSTKSFASPRSSPSTNSPKNTKSLATARRSKRCSVSLSPNLSVI